MVQRKLIWTAFSRETKRAIFNFWNEKNKSNTYSKRLNTLFEQKTELLKQQPYLGTIISPKDDKHFLLVENFLLVYTITPREIHLLFVWDGRRNPEDFNKLLKLH